ncbi:MAG: hypothetical protein NC080_04025 [Paraprevotella sp.]|nr:hypothetical protein [Paraprevotella sp.]
MDTTRIYRTHLLLTILMVVFLLHSTICKAQTFIYPQNDSILTEYNDGKFWAYFNKNDFVVGLSCFETKDDYGKYYHLDIFIRNLSETPIIFQPDSVHSNLLTKKDDTLELEVYTNEEYQKKIKGLQAWTMAAMAMYGISAGINAGVAFTNQMLLGRMLDNDRTVSEQGYLKTTTIYPGEAIIGYMNIKRKKGKILVVNIPVGKFIYTFKWDVNRKK